MPDDLADRIANAERGMFDDEDDVERKAKRAETADTRCGRRAAE